MSHIQTDRVRVAEAFSVETRRGPYLSDLVVRGLRDVPDDLVTGLAEIVLRDHASLSQKETEVLALSRSGRVPLQALRGVYYPSAAGPRIEIFVDAIASEWPSSFLFLPFVRDYIVLKVLYHEIGHHIEFRRGAADKSSGRSEAKADQWSNDLLRHYFRAQYPVMIRLLWPAERLLGMLRFLRGLLPGGRSVS